MRYSYHQALGNIGERWAYDQLKERGYDVLMVPDYQAACIDLRIGVLPVEVKYSRVGRKRKVNKATGEVRYYQRWQWNVLQVKSDIDRVLILIAEDRAGIRHPFIMPSSVMATRSQFEIWRHPRDYRGLIAGYLNAWETIDFLLEQQYYDDRQLTIYHYLTGEAETAK